MAEQEDWSKKLKNTINSFSYGTMDDDLPPLGRCGDSGVYHLGDGCYTGKGGWEYFCGELDKN